MVAPPAPGSLLGRIDSADRNGLSGWAMDAARPGEPVTLEVCLDGEVLGTFLAGRPRPDLAAAGLGDGAHGFEVRIPDGLSLHADRVLEVRRAADGRALAGSPVVLRRVALDGAGARRAVQDAVEAAASGATRAELEALLRHLVAAIAALDPAPPPHHAALLGRWGAGAAPRQGEGPWALVIDESIPDTGRDAGSAAVLSHMRSLQRLGWRVAFVPAWSPDAAPAAIAGLAAEGVEVWHAPWIGSVEEVLRRGGARWRLVYLHRLGVMDRYAALVRRWCPEARLVYCLADLHHLRARRQAHVAAIGNAGAGWDALALESTGKDPLAVAELAAIRAADIPLTHSPAERALLARLLPEVTVHVVPWAVALPPPVTIPPAARAGVAFVGSYGHPPNLDAACELVEAVMPLVWAEDPTIPCLLAGSDLPATLRATALAASGPVEVLGRVPALAELWNRTLLAAAPLRFGAGIKGKVLDALAAGIPCVMSPVAAEGLDLPPALAGLVQGDAAGMAAAILRLHDDRAAVERLAAAGRAYVGERNAEEVVDRALGAAVGKEGVLF